MSVANTNSFLKDFVEGMLVLPRGLQLLFAKKRLLALAVIPFLIALGLLVWGITWATGTLPTLVASALMWLTLTGMYFSILYYVGLIIAWPAFLLGLLFVLFLVVKIVASPFHSLLAEAALTELGDLPPHGFSIVSWLVTSVKMLFISLAEVLVLSIVGLVLFVISFLPFVNLLAAFGFFLIIAFDAADFSFEAKRFGFAKRFTYFMENLPSFSGVAVSMGIIFLVPGISLILFPAAVVGSADLIARIEKRKR